MPMRYFLVLLLLVTHARAESLEYESARYQLYRVPKQDYARLHLRWLDSKWQPLSNFGALQS